MTLKLQSINHQTLLQKEEVELFNLLKPINPVKLQMQQSTTPNIPFAESDATLVASYDTSVVDS